MRQTDKQPAEISPDTRKKSARREHFESICVAVILALFIRTFVVQAFKIPTGSMENNLLIGDHLLVNKMVFGPTATPVEDKLIPIRDIRRHDVVVFKYPMEPERDFIKRVIALPGESIRISSKRVFIDGEPLDEPFTYYAEPPGHSEIGAFFDSRRDDMPEMVVPEGHYFVMGDNRDNSHDSRFWGALPRDLIKGRALIVYWSYAAPKEAYLATDLADRFKDLFEVILNFHKNTRWDRFFHLVR